MLRPATHADAASIRALRESLTHWQRSNGITQWEPGEIPLTTLEKQARLGEWWVLDGAEELVAAVRVVDDDPGIWSTADGVDAGYIHGLMVARVRAGEGLGAAILREAEAIVQAGGHQVVRLDCVASNTVLRRYYEERGYVLVGERSFPLGSGWHPVALFEKKLDATPPHLAT